MLKFNHVLLSVVFLFFVNFKVYSQNKTTENHIEEAFLIKAGLGFDKVKIGEDLKTVYSSLGKPDNEDSMYLSYYHLGVELSLDKNKKVAAIFLFFRDKKSMTFDGSTSEKIGFSSTIPQVIRAYGKPDRISESIVSQYGTFPGANNYFLSYDKKGIAFSFYDNELGDIRIYKAE